MSREPNIYLIREACRADKKRVRLDDVLNAIVEKNRGKMRRICDLYRQACVRKSQDPVLTWNMGHDVLEERDEVLEMFAITLELTPLPDWLAVSAPVLWTQACHAASLREAVSNQFRRACSGLWKPVFSTSQEAL